MVKLSIVIITLNEEKYIAECIDSVQEVADEVVVVDSFSTDKTKEICLAKGVRVIENPFEGHIQQKNFAVSQAKYDHVLSLDADERLSDVLAASIMEVKENWKYDGYYFNRLSFYCGKFIKHGSWYPDRKLRLFKKGKGSWGGKNPHDEYQIEGSKKYLKGDIIHYTYERIKDHVAKANYFSEIAANEAYKKGTKSNIIKVFINPAWRFVRDYFQMLGFLDGHRGVAIAAISSMETFLKYIKLWQLNRP